MGKITEKLVFAPRNRVRFRIGTRGLSFVILLLALVLGWFHHANRRVNERDLLLSKLQGEGVLVNHRDPSYLCLFLMKAHGDSSGSIEERYTKWISPGWFSSPRGFNAGLLPEAKVKPLVERLQVLGPVNEVLFRNGTHDGLRLFYIGKIPYHALGPEKSGCLIREHGAKGGAEFHRISTDRQASLSSF